MYVFPCRVNYMNQTGATKQLSFRLKYTDWLQLPSQTLYRVIKSGKRSMKISLFWLFSWNKRLLLGLVKPITFRNRDEYIYCVSGNWQPWAYIFVQAKGAFGSFGRNWHHHPKLEPGNFDVPVILFYVNVLRNFVTSKKSDSV